MRSLIFLSVFMVLQQVLSQEYDYDDGASNTTPQPNLRRRPPQRPAQHPLTGQLPAQTSPQRPAQRPLTGQLPAQTSPLHYNKPEGPNEMPQQPKVIRATCNVQPNVNLIGKPTYQPVNGSVILTQELFPTNMGPLQLDINLSGFIPHESSKENNLHGFHIHTFGDIVGGCESAGSHFNPFNQTHGGPKDKIRHLGDLGNIEVDYDIVSTKIVDEKLSLLGPLTIIGRSIVVHEKEDDLGRGGDAESKKTGNAGARLACCVIGLAAPPE